jgi:hypothetical protein
MYQVRDMYHMTIYNFDILEEAIDWAKEYTIEHAENIYIWHLGECIKAYEDGKEI